MSSLNSELLEKIRQQFDAAPYPRIPLEVSPKESPNYLHLHNVVTPYYLRNQRVFDTEGALILDAGCGSGYKSLALAQSNPGAKIVGIDLSEESVKLARQRLTYYGFEEAEFRVLTIEELPNLGLQFDYINCDEVLYLLPDPVVGLEAMKSVLKPSGIIRANLHSALQRAIYYQAQEFFTLIGLMQASPTDAELSAVREIMKALKRHVKLKVLAWGPGFEEEDEHLLANHLLRGDKGSTLPEFFSALRAAELEFINMVNWRQWDLVNLFEDLNELPLEIVMGLAEKSVEEQLHLFELLHPVHRLLDLWCGHPNQSQTYTPVADWTDAEWQQSTVHLHPLLKARSEFKDDLITCITELKMFEINRHLPTTEGVVNIDSLMASCLLPLLEGPQPLVALIQHWTRLRPLNPVTLQPTEDREAFELIKQLFIQLERLGYALLEIQP